MQAKQSESTYRNQEVRRAGSGWRPFRCGFQRRQLRPYPPTGPLPAAGIAVGELCRSLAIFQCGEVGEGRIAREVDLIELPGVDREYSLCVKLFVAEEGRHAAILGRTVQALGGKLLSQHNSASLFRELRRAFGFRFKIIILLLAEIVGRAYYLSIARLYPRSWLSPALGQIARDEAVHLVFHARFLALSSRRRLDSAAAAAILFAITVAALAYTFVSHRRALGRMKGAFLIQALRHLMAACARILNRNKAAAKEVRTHRWQDATA